MQEYNEIQAHIDEITMTTAEKRHDQQQQAAARRLEQMADKRLKEALRKAMAAIPDGAMDDAAS